MLLFEFTGADPLLVDLVSVIGQLKSEIDAGTKKPDWTVDELLKYINNNSPEGRSIIIDKDDLYDMIKIPPLNRSIKNIQGDTVIFKNQESDVEGSHDVDQDQKVVKQMAQSAMK